MFCESKERKKEEECIDIYYELSWCAATGSANHT